MPKLYRPQYRDKKTGEPRQTRSYYVRIRHADGVRRLVKLSPNISAARVMLAKLVADIENEKASPSTAFDKANRRPLSEHVADWGRDLAAGGASPKHVRQKLACCRRVFADCCAEVAGDVTESAVRGAVAAMRRAADLPPLPAPSSPSGYTRAELAAALGVDPPAVTAMLKRHALGGVGNARAKRFPAATAEALHAMKREGLSIRSANGYAGAAKQFCAWMVRDGRLRANPLAGLSLPDPEADRRVVFATLTAGELQSLLTAAHASAEVSRGLAGPDRAVLYQVALLTTFRPVELSRLTPADFALEGDVPFVRLDGKRTKNGRPCDQALTPEVASLLADYLAGRDPAAPVWPGTWHERAADMIRVDLTPAGIPFVKPGPDGQVLTVGFYSIRHSAGLLAEANGATLRDVMTLMRHSDPKLTLKTYGKLDRAGRAATVAKLPQLRADREKPTPDRLGQNPATTCHKPGQTDRDGPGRPGTDSAGEAPGGAGGTLGNVADEDGLGRSGTGKDTDPGAARTHNRPLRRRLLYPVELRGRSGSSLPRAGRSPKATRPHSGPGGTRVSRGRVSR